MNLIMNPLKQFSMTISSLDLNSPTATSQLWIITASVMFHCYLSESSRLTIHWCRTHNCAILVWLERKSFLKDQSRWILFFLQEDSRGVAFTWLRVGGITIENKPSINSSAFLWQMVFAVSALIRVISIATTHWIKKDRFACKPPSALFFAFTCDRLYNHINQKNPSAFWIQFYLLIRGGW